ncbi:Disease resistance protein [Sesamum alatum]|uniref:Disease resistance protein n=1 Tax=Sesamum alatum TaxID=300844 RepID=A0AAE2CA00_9LAMI|nr:Disease resistance protein [Sesamum alatum]
MEIVASVVGSLLAEPCRALFMFLRDKLRNSLHFTANLVALDKEMANLIERRNQLREHLALAATAGLQAPSQVMDWLRRVNTLEDQQVFLIGVARKLGEARKLTMMGISRKYGCPDPSIVRSQYIPAPAIDDQATASRNMAKVMDLLSSEEVKRIGIWGMGGVGKTTLIKNINNKLTRPSPMTEVTLKIEVLNEEEAWKLFCTSAGEVAILEEVEPLARLSRRNVLDYRWQSMLSGILKGEANDELWNDALNALRRSEPLIRGKIEDRDFEITVERLVRYWLAEGLLEEHYDIEEVMDRGVVIIETLKECSLLAQDNWSTVKIHDVIRDVSIPEQFLLAFMSLRILDLSECESIKCLPACLDRLVELRCLLLDKCKHLETLPPVGGLAKLQVLVCSETRITALPKSQKYSYHFFWWPFHEASAFEGNPSIGRTDGVGCSRACMALFSVLQWLGTMFEKFVANSDEVGCFDTLQILQIFGCTDWVGVGSNAKFDMLPNLRDILFLDFNNISCILDLAMPLGLKFFQLQYMKITRCSQLKYLISLGTTILTLEKLEAIYVNDCEQVEELFKFEQNSGLDSVFPSLKRIMLRKVSEIEVSE